MVRTLLCKAAMPPHHGHDFRKRKLPLATAPSCAVSRSKHFATQNDLLSKFCYAKPPTASAVFAVFDRPVFFGVHTLRFTGQNFASQSCLRQPHLSLRFIVQNFASQSGYATASWSKHFATQNGLRPPRFLRGAYFAVHKRIHLNFEFGRF